MAKLGLSMRCCVPFQIAIIVLVVSTKGDLLTPPTNVHFKPGFFHRILNWSHNRTGIDGALYQVQYRRYGSNWTSVPNCTFITNQSCDLTVETLPKSLGYYAQVRVVLGDQTSEWTRTNRFTFKDVVLPPPSLHLKVDGPSIRVQLDLPEFTVGNVTTSLKDLFEYGRVYTLDIQRTSDSHMFQLVKHCETFHITDLADGEEYCITIQPSIDSRGNIGEVTSVNCINLPEQEVSSSTLLVVASCILTFVVLLILVNIFICQYTRRVVKTPKTLKSLIQRSWSWMDKPPSPVIETNLHWEIGLGEHLMAEHRNSLMRSSADSGFGSQIFVCNISKSSQELSVGESLSKLKFIITDINTQEDNSSEKCEDSGISLSTDSQHNDSSDDGDIQSSGNCRETAVENDGDIQSCGNFSETVVVMERLGYLRQQEQEEISAKKELESTWQPQIKEYISQRPKNQQMEFPHQKDVDSLIEPWTEFPETLQSLLPLTVGFSPFSNKCWDLGVGALSLGDVELMDTRS